MIYFHFYVSHSFILLFLNLSPSPIVWSSSMCVNGEKGAPRQRKISYPAYNCCSNPLWEDRFRTTTGQERHCHIVWFIYFFHKKERHSFYYFLFLRVSKIKTSKRFYWNSKRCIQLTCFLAIQTENDVAAVYLLHWPLQQFEILSLITLNWRWRTDWNN